MKILWICHFSNTKVRSHMNNKVGLVESVVRKFLKKPCHNFDFAQWNTNAIKEFEKFTDVVELHVISPSYTMQDFESVFEENGIHYYFFKDENSGLKSFLKAFVDEREYSNNRKYIADKIKEIEPDLIHVIGAENPQYSLAALDIPRSIPVFVQLQTLMIDPEFKKNYPISEKSYAYRSGSERQILERADYIGTPEKKFVNVINNLLEHKGPILGTSLAVAESLNFSNCEKKFDFVYFALDISKAADYAIEAFSIASQQNQSITLDVVGNFSISLKKQLDARIDELGLRDKITFEGKLATHDDVISQIRKSRFALLPLKIDLLSGTIREAMANGLPVVSTITPETPNLNKKRESVLLSPAGDFSAMADNMLKLLNDENFAEKIRENACITASERVNNEQIIRKWIDAYRASIDNFKNGTPIPVHLLH